MARLSRQGAVTWAGTYAYKLLATDPRYNGNVLIVHRDGSVFFLNSSFAIRRPGYLVVFTEHHGYRVFDEEDLVSSMAFGARIEIPILRVDPDI